MATYKELKEAIDKVAAIKVDGFDNNWLLRAFARKQALINIEKIKPHADKYNLIVRYLITGDESIRKEVRSAAAYAAYAAADAAAAAADAAAYAAAADAAAYAAAADAADAAAYAAADAADAADAARDSAIKMLEEMVAEYISLLSTPVQVEELTLEQICKELGRDVKVVGS